MFVAHGIPSFYEVLCTNIYRFADRVSKNSNSLIMACMHSYCLYSLSHSTMAEISVMLISTILLCDILLLLLYCSYICLTIFLYVYGPCVCNKDILL